ncbi:unnamed protein product [Scytosiphon promiscuus]
MRGPRGFFAVTRGGYEWGEFDCIVGLYHLRLVFCCSGSCVWAQVDVSALVSRENEVQGNSRLPLAFFIPTLDFARFGFLAVVPGTSSLFKFLSSCVFVHPWLRRSLKRKNAHPFRLDGMARQWYRYRASTRKHSSSSTSTPGGQRTSCATLAIGAPAAIVSSCYFHTPCREITTGRSLFPRFIGTPWCGTSEFAQHYGI